MGLTYDFMCHKIHNELSIFKGLKMKKVSVYAKGDLASNSTGRSDQKHHPENFCVLFYSLLPLTVFTKISLFCNVNWTLSSSGFIPRIFNTFVGIAMHQLFPLLKNFFSIIFTLPYIINNLYITLFVILLYMTNVYFLILTFNSIMTYYFEKKVYFRHSNLKINT